MLKLKCDHCGTPVERIKTNGIIVSCFNCKRIRQNNASKKFYLNKKYATISNTSSD